MGHWDRGVSAVGDILSVSACHVIEGNLITSPQPPLAPAPVRNRTEAGEQDHINHKRILPGARSLSQLCQNNIQTTVVTLLHLRWTHPKPQTYSMSSSYLVSASSSLICPSLSFRMNQAIVLLFLSSHSLTLLSFISSPPCSQPFLSFLFSWLPVSLHAHLLSTIDNIPDGAPLLATHGQINQSNNTPINSNYALISPGRAPLGAGTDIAVVEWLGVFKYRIKKHVCAYIYMCVAQDCF